MEQKKTVVYIVYRLSVGGSENGIANLINYSSEGRYRNIVISLTDHDDFRFRIRQSDTEFYEMHKKEGRNYGVYFRLWRLLRKLKPDVLHSCGIGTLECTIPAFFAGVKCRMHGEHGRDMIDIDGTNKKYIFLRRICSPFVSFFIPLSKDLESWLIDSVSIAPDKIIQLYNGVDIERFSPSEEAVSDQPIVIGTVGRLSGEKDQLTLLEAFIGLKKAVSEKLDIQLSIVGDGALREEIQQRVNSENLEDCVNLVGKRDDIPEQLRKMDIFVLPSLGEGISNTILEAMASGLPVIATNVGGNPELVQEGQTGFIVPSANPDAMAQAIKKYLDQPALIMKHGLAGRERVEEKFSIQRMTERYFTLYDDCKKNNNK